MKIVTFFDLKFYRWCWFRFAQNSFRKNIYSEIRFNFHGVFLPQWIYTTSQIRLLANKPKYVAHKLYKTKKDCNNLFQQSLIRFSWDWYSKCGIKCGIFLVRCHLHWILKRLDTIRKIKLFTTQQAFYNELTDTDQ